MSTNDEVNPNDATAVSAGTPDDAPRTKRRKRPVLWTFLTLLALAIIGPILGFMVAYLMADVPEPDQLATKQVSTIYASDSSTELARIVPPDGNRQQVPFDQIPESLANAVLAAEDREFWTNPGFSITGFGRAVIGQLTGNSSAGGGSTITQQYVKNVLVGNEHSIDRKVRELVYSTKMANEWSKEDVLAAYLNTVYFGRNAYGVESAANAYFGKPARDLTPEEGAVLAAAIQRPSQLDPWVNRRSRRRAGITCSTAWWIRASSALRSVLTPSTRRPWTPPHTAPTPRRRAPTA